MQADEINNSIVYKPEVLEFVKSSNRYCQLVDQLKEGEGRQFLNSMLVLLPGIYSVMAGLESFDPVYDEGNEKNVTEQNWSDVYQKIAGLFGHANSYLRRADEDEFDRSDLVVHTISEDLADIYQELKDFIELYRIGLEEVMNDALWEVHENFLEHWGKKLLNALGAMHQLLVKGFDPDQPDKEDRSSDQSQSIYDNSMFRKFSDQSGEEN